MKRVGVYNEEILFTHRLKFRDQREGIQGKDCWQPNVSVGFSRTVVKWLTQLHVDFRGFWNSIAPSVRKNSFLTHTSAPFGKYDYRGVHEMSWIELQSDEVKPCVTKVMQGR